MDYEKKYKNALERARDVYTYYCDDREQLRKIESIFPELAESEDERIRKGLLSYVNVVKAEAIARFPKEDILLEDIKIDDAIAWLEKQKEEGK